MANPSPPRQIIRSALDIESILCSSSSSPEECLLKNQQSYILLKNPQQSSPPVSSTQKLPSLRGVIASTTKDDPWAATEFCNPLGDSNGCSLRRNSCVSVSNLYGLDPKRLNTAPSMEFHMLQPVAAPTSLYYHSSPHPKPRSLSLFRNLSNGQFGCKAKRKRANSNQVRALNEVFRHTFFPSTELRAQLAEKIRMSPRAVQIWFQNKRHAYRMQSEEAAARVALEKKNGSKDFADLELDFMTIDTAFSGPSSPRTPTEEASTNRIYFYEESDPKQTLITTGSSSFHRRSLSLDNGGA